MRFNDRADAGRRLASQLAHLRGANLAVLGLPRGGVPVAYEVARALGAPLDVIVVRKLGVPFQPELAMGAIGEGGVRVINQDIVRRGGISDDEIAVVEERERADLARQAELFRAGRPSTEVAGRTVIVVDDGIATGSTASAACRVARQLGAARVVLAVPVGAPESLDELSAVADEIVCLAAPPYFVAVGTWYDDFRHVADEEVTALLSRAQAEREAAQAPAGAGSAAAGGDQARASSDRTQLFGAAVSPHGRDEPVEILAAGVTLPGQLTIPPGAPGTVVFVHGSGSSRHSPRNKHVADQLRAAGLGTLLFDLLTSDEELDRANVFDIGTLADRLTAVTGWLRAQPEGGGGALGYFGASTGAAAALWAAAEPGAHVDAIVSRGGRPDLAGPRLAEVRAPVLLIVGGHDDLVLGLNREAHGMLRCEARLEVVPGATHLFEEPGALDVVTRLAREWFTGHFAPA